MLLMMKWKDKRRETFNQEQCRKKLKETSIVNISIQQGERDSKSAIHFF